MFGFSLFLSLDVSCRALFGEAVDEPHHNHGKRPNIDNICVVLAEENFWSLIQIRSAIGLQIRSVLGQSEVRQLNVERRSRIDEDVIWLQVSMCDFLAVEIRKTFETLIEDNQRISLADGGDSVLCLEASQRQVFHHDKGIRYSPRVNEPYDIILERVSDLTTKRL